MNTKQAKQRFGIIGNTPQLERAIDVALQVAPTDISILVFGESCCMQIERVFSTTPELENKIELRHKNELFMHSSKAGDSFKIMLKDIIQCFASGKVEKFYNWLENDAKFRETLYNCAKKWDTQEEST